MPQLIIYENMQQLALREESRKCPFHPANPNEKATPGFYKYFYPVWGLSAFPVTSLKAVPSQGPADKLIYTYISQ